MRLLDETWCGMKRTHWGVTLKIIGQVPGTGGTAGASYLQRSAATPLFPLLAEPATGPAAPAAAHPSAFAQQGHRS